MLIPEIRNRFHYRSVNTESTSEDETERIRRSPIVVPKSQGLREMCRDVLGCVLVMIASCLVYFTDSQVAKFVDPIIAIISAVSLFFISLPYSELDIYWSFEEKTFEKKSMPCDIDSRFFFVSLSEGIGPDSLADHSESHQHCFPAKRSPRGIS